MAVVALLGLALGVAVLVAFARSARANKFPVPPGPKPLLLVGNIFDLTTKELWLRATGWAKQYGASRLRFMLLPIHHVRSGPIIYLKLLREEIVILSSRQAASEFLEKHSLSYADRPQNQVLLQM